MRLITTMKNKEEGQQLVDFLQSQGISATAEPHTHRDWDSDQYGDQVSDIWITNEDQVPQAFEWLEKFLADPKAEEFQNIKPPPPKKKKRRSLSFKKIRNRSRSARPMGPVTLYLLLTCVWIFIWSQMTSPSLETFPTNLPATPVLTSPVHKQLLFDYPKPYVLIDKAIKLYGLDKLSAPQELPPEGQLLLNEAVTTPLWTGFYYKISDFAKGKTVEWTPKVPLFEQIRAGEWWRLWTPCLLHNDIFHILFNMIWLIVIGKQMEKRLGVPRYVLFILFTGIFSNTAQYLMSGANFIGFSGVLCAMLTFVWKRQQLSPWEGYQLQRSTMGLVTFFILGVFLLQLIAFTTDVVLDLDFTPGIANTAHLSGAFIGYLLGGMRFFAAK